MAFKRWFQEAQFLLEYLLVWPGITLVRALSEAQSRALVRGVSRIIYRLLSWERRWCLKNLELVFGDNLTPDQRIRLAQKVIEHNLLTIVEAVRWTPAWMQDQVIKDGGWEEFETSQEAITQGKGSIIISAHMGNFELIPAWFDHHGMGGPVMYRPQKNWRIDRLILGARAKYMKREGLVQQGTFGLLDLMYSLREGQRVGMLIDQNTGDGGVFVDFMGFQAASPPAAAALALSTGAPVFLVVSIRQADGRHRLIFHPPFPLVRTGNRTRDIKANTQQYTQALEPYVLAYPEQYNWAFPRWRNRPDQSRWTLDIPNETLAAERNGPPRRLAPALGNPPSQSQAA